MLSKSHRLTDPEFSSKNVQRSIEVGLKCSHRTHLPFSIENTLRFHTHNKYVVIINTKFTFHHNDYVMPTIIETISKYYNNDGNIAGFKTILI